MTKKLHSITGPTAVGKTAFSLRFAEERGAEIVNADALLVYRGMDIGTAKPTPEERQRVPHHLIDLREIDEPYDIGSYEEEARRTVEAIAARGRPVVVTGGSGFYLKSFFSPAVDRVRVPETVRAEVRDLFAEEGLEGVLRELRARNPEGLGRLDVDNPRRVLRALERCRASGRSLAELEAAFAALPTPYADWEKELICLDRGRAALEERVARRARQMVRSGLIEEVRRLREKGLERNPSAASAIGYRESLAFLRGELGEDQLLPAICQNTLRLIKKQRTWFRTQLPPPDRREWLED